MEARTKQGSRSLQFYREFQLRLGRVQHAAGDVQHSREDQWTGGGVSAGESVLCLAQSGGCDTRPPGLSKSEPHPALVPELPRHQEKSSLYREASTPWKYLFLI